MRFRRHLLVISMAAACAAAGVSRTLPPISDTAISAQNPQQPDRQAAQGELSLKVNVNLVTVDAVVRNNQGTTVGELQAEDFVIYDNGVAQQLTHFSRDQLPLAVALVIDRSPSIAPFLKQLRSAALSALNRLKPEDQVVLFSFDICPTRLSDLTGDRPQIARRIGEIHIGTSTNIYGAIFNAAHYLHEAAPDRRRVIILISDNFPNVFHISENDVVREALEAGVTLYSIRTPGENPSPGRGLSRPMFRGQGLAHPSSIERIARETGGEVLNLSTAGEFSQALDSAILNLRLGYTLGFTPSNLGESGSYHRLVVKVEAGHRCSDCFVQARAGYYVGLRSSLPQGSAGSTGTYDCEQAVAYEFLRSPYALVPEVDDVPFKVALAETSDAGDQRQVKVDLQIDARKVNFQTANDRHFGRLLIAVFYMDKEGNRLGEDWKRIDMELREETYQRLLRSGIPSSSLIPLKVPKQILRVFVYDLRSRRFGIRQVKMK